MDRVVLFLGVEMPWLRSVVRGVVAELVVRRGYPGRANVFAVAVGLRDRYHLARLLHREGLPSLEELAAWIRLITWVAAWEERRMPLSAAALASLRDPSPMFRLVDRLTGRAWTEVRSLGSDWVLLRMLERCRHSSKADYKRVSGA